MDNEPSLSQRWVNQLDMKVLSTPSAADVRMYQGLLKAAAQKAQADAWKLSKTDELFLKAIKIKP